MTPPDTNLMTERRRHRGPLVGMALAVLAVGAYFVWWISHETTATDGPAGAPVQIDGRTGAAGAPEIPGPEIPGPAETPATPAPPAETPPAPPVEAPAPADPAPAGTPVPEVPPPAGSPAD